MKLPVKKVIKASAGTGKTYRLSLEFVNLLLEKEVQFDEILVITFTKKATAEVREAIFSHLRNLIEKNDKGTELSANLLKYCQREINNNDLARLNNIYKEMLANKHKVRVSTIDSFVTAIFKGIIAPYLGIADFEINNEINERYLPEIYNNLLNREGFIDRFMNLFQTSKFKTIDRYNKLITSIINNRWMLEMLEEAPSQLQAAADPNQHRNEFIATMKTVIEIFINYLNDARKSNDEPSQVIKKAYLDLNIVAINATEWLDSFSNMITSSDFLKVYWNILINDLKFWNGGKCLRKRDDKETKETLIELTNTATEHLADYIFTEYALEEQEALKKLANELLAEYDRIKMRDRIFTYSDISYYTYKHLYNPELSLIDEDNGTVLNRFYEHLSATTRFMLIDEYQDTSIIQHKILFPIIKEVVSGYGQKDYGGVIIVGDEKQSIYGWRSGERELLLKIPTILQVDELNEQEQADLNLVLDTSYRSTQFVMDFINAFFGKISESYSQAFFGTDESDTAFDKHKSLTTWKYAPIKAHKETDEGFVGIYFNNYSSTNDNAIDKYQCFVENIIRARYRNNEIDLSKSAILADSNNQLEQIATLLEENGIPCYREATVSILQYRAIKPIIILLKYLSSRNILYLLQFIRSDACLLSPKDLKDVIIAFNSDGDFSHCSEATQRILSKINMLEEESNTLDILALITRIIEEFNITGLFPDDFHIKNIHLFLEIAADYLASITKIQSQSIEKTYYQNIEGFLDYLEENKNNEEFMQMSLEVTNAIKLLTVHKSKGLQFESVFYYCERTRGDGRMRELKTYLRYDEDLRNLQEGYLLFNYNAAMKNITVTDIFKVKNAKDLLDDLNAIYVALTRAEKNIFIYQPYQNARGLMAHYNKLIGEEKNKFTVYDYFFVKLVDYLRDEKGFTIDNNLFSSYEFGALSVLSEAPTVPTQDEPSPQPDSHLENLAHYVSLNNSEFIKEITEESHIDYKSVYVTNKLPLKGELVHYYLSFISYAKSDEMQIAANKTKSFFGNIFSIETIERIIEEVNDFITDNQHLFETRWQIFNERVIFDDYGNEYRMDRLMIDNENKEILIIDYKTGTPAEREQLDIYSRIIANLPFVKDNDYRIETKYVEIPIER